MAKSKVFALLLIDKAKMKCYVYANIVSVFGSKSYRV